MKTSTTIERSTDSARAPTVAKPVSDARRGVLTYLIVVTAMSGVLYTVIIVARVLLPFVVLLMFVPGAASVAVRLARHEGFADVSFRSGGRGGLIWIAIGLILPWIVGA